MKKFLLLLCCLCLTGCSHTYLERQVYPLCMSVDLSQDGRWQVGLQAPRSASGDQTTYDVFSALGDTPRDALRVLAASIPYPLHFSQLRLCLISYHAAATQPLLPLLRQILELPGMRPDATAAVAMGSALHCMQAQKPDFGMRLSTHLTVLFERLRREKTLPHSALSYCVRELSDGRSDLLLGLCAINAAVPTFSVGEPWTDARLPEDLSPGMLPREGTNPLEFLGAAAVSDGRVGGTLTARQTQLALRLLDEAKRTVENGQLCIRTDQPHDEVRSLLSHLQALGSDVLRFGCEASRAFATDADWERAAFRRQYPHLPVLVENP